MTDLSEQASTLSDLLERVRGATGPSRELDADLYRALGYEVRQSGDGFWTWSQSGGSDLRILPKFTASLDAALALVERVLPGWEWSVGSDQGCAIATVWTPHAGVDDLDVGGPTPALAILAALLSALLAQASETAHADD